MAEFDKAPDAAFDEDTNTATKEDHCISDFSKSARLESTRCVRRPFSHWPRLLARFLLPHWQMRGKPTSAPNASQAMS
eukprot:7459818-Pyramimonas_sp.AAC.1